MHHTPIGIHNQKKRVVIVDDSSTLRAWLRVVLEKDNRLEVVGEADCAANARQVIKLTNPDVITLDIEMPGMSGLDFLQKLMTLFPKPVVMISGATESNSIATVTALSLGAVDCILKPSQGVTPQEGKSIARRVFSAACGKVQTLQRPPTSVSRNKSNLPDGPLPLIVIGASTGGVAALERVLADLHVDGPPVVIVQHMPGNFLASFAQQLDRNLEQDVGVARSHEPLSRGQIRLAPGMAYHTLVRRSGGDWSCDFAQDVEDSLHCPSVDALFFSAEPFGKDTIGVILTGLGRDGSKGLLALREAGAHTIGQDEETSVVYGMPRAAFEGGAVCEQLALPKIGHAINRAVMRHVHLQRGMRN